MINQNGRSKPGILGPERGLTLSSLLLCVYTISLDLYVLAGDSVEEVQGKLRGQLRNVRKVEAEIAALKISSLKRINKGSKLVIIDS